MLHCCVYKEGKWCEKMRKNIQVAILKANAGGHDTAFVRLNYYYSIS